ncbi:hypothetical protein [Nonomuraea sp. NPDC050783]|uniref:hypothetical protein n=1 Tax=Nonomuraea sp. NPDC050783 TaxID=3154634 RepID=UPI00346527D1
MKISRYSVGHEVAALPQPVPPAQLTAQIVAARIEDSFVQAVNVDTTRVADATEAELLALRWLLADNSCYAGMAGKTYHQIVTFGEGRHGQVVFRYTAAAQGGMNVDGTAVFLGRGLPYGAATADAATLKQELGGTYGVRFSGNWTDVELTKVKCALSLVPEADREAVRGVEFARVAGLSGDGHNGYTLALFEHTFAAHIASTGTVKVATAAFDKDARGFVGTYERRLPPSVRVLLHEIGHAVESAPHRIDAWRNTTVTVNGLHPGTVQDHTPVTQDVLDEALRLHHRDFSELNKLSLLASGTYNAALHKEPEVKKLIADCAARKGKLAVLAGQVTAMLDDPGKGDIAAKTVKDIQADFRAITDAYTYAAKMLSGGPYTDDSYQELKRDAANLSQDVIWQPYREELLRWADVRLRQNAWEALHKTWQGGRTGREQNFVRYVNQQNIGYDLTNYSTTHWRSIDRFGYELYAEAYSYWLVHPDALTAHHAQLLPYFTNGTHRISAT